ncbi:MAG: hypothetical protein ACREUD_00160 [Gammaproteobacteria bacterium]
MNDEQIQTIEQIRGFLAGSEAMEFSVEGSQERDCFAGEIAPDCPGSIMGLEGEVIGCAILKTGEADTSCYPAIKVSQCETIPRTGMRFLALRFNCFV